MTDEATAIQMAHAELARGRYRGLFDKLNLPRDLKALTGDLTVIYGDRDALTWRHLEERRERVMRWNDNAEFHVIPGAGHWVQYQAADVVNDILVRRFA